MQQIDGALLQNAGTNAGQNIVGALAFNDDVVDASLVKQSAEQQACRASANDGNLSAHGYLL